MAGGRAVQCQPLVRRYDVCACYGNGAGTPAAPSPFRAAAPSRFANESAMQALGGPSATLGFILAAVGVGCIAGPLIANAAVPALPRWWRASIAASFLLLALGYGLMAVAQHIGVVLAATLVRAMGGLSRGLARARARRPTHCV